MPKIVLDITDEAVDSYAEARGVVGGTPQSNTDFMGECLVIHIQEVVEFDAIDKAKKEAADKVVVPKVTKDKE